MNDRIRTLATTLALLTGTALAAGAQPKPAAQPAAHKSSAVRIRGSAKLKAQAKISGDSATAIALGQVPNGKVSSAEIENEGGKLIYSFDMKVAGKSGIDEVNVDALTGAVVATQHESAKTEAKEKKADAKAAAATKKPAKP